MTKRYDHLTPWLSLVGVCLTVAVLICPKLSHAEHEYEHEGKPGQEEQGYEEDEHEEGGHEEHGHEHILTWSPMELSEKIGTGQTKTETVSLISTKNLAYVGVKISHKLQPYLKVVPDTFSSISAGTPVTLTITFTVPSDVHRKTFKGALQLITNSTHKTIGKRLPIALKICRCFESNDLSLHYPPSPKWQLDSQSLELGGPLEFNNFNHAYINGGIVPIGGAEITVTKVPLPTDPLPDFIQKELIDSLDVFKSDVIVGGKPATRVTSSDFYVGSLTVKTVAVYVPHQATLYKFYLSYNAGDTSENEFLSAFQRLLDSVKFTTP